MSVKVQGPRWVVRSGHSQPGPYTGPPATQTTSGCVEAAADSPRVLQSPRYPQHSKAAPWKPSRIVGWQVERPLLRRSPDNS